MPGRRFCNKDVLAGPWITLMFQRRTGGTPDDGSVSTKFLDDAIVDV